MPLPFTTFVFVSLSVALIVTSPVVVSGVIVTFAPAFSLSLTASFAIDSACFLLTASVGFSPSLMFVICAPPKSNELPVPFEIVASPIFTLLLNSAEVRPVRALASLIFSVSPLASTPMLLVLSSVVAPPLIFSSLFV